MHVADLYNAGLARQQGNTHTTMCRWRERARIQKKARPQQPARRHSSALQPRSNIAAFQGDADAAAPKNQEFCRSFCEPSLAVVELQRATASRTACWLGLQTGCWRGPFPTPSRTGLHLWLRTLRTIDRFPDQDIHPLVQRPALAADGHRPGASPGPSPPSGILPWFNRRRVQGLVDLGFRVWYA